MIKFACSNCSKSIRVDEKYAGKKGKCPKCGTAVVVPERSTIIEFHCDGCGAKIKVPDRHAGKKGKCPKCEAPIVVPALTEAPVEPEMAPEPEAPVEPELPPEPDAFDEPAPEEELYEEPAPAPRQAAGLDRRLVIAIAGAVVVVIVVAIGLVIFLRSGGSEPPVAPRPRRETTRTEAPPEPTAAEETTVEEAPVESAVTPPAANGAVTLQFAPRPGEKQTRRVTTRAAISAEQMGQKQEVVSTQTFTVDLEAGEAQPDETIPIRVTLAQIQVTTEMRGVVQGEYDSAKPESESALMAPYYVPFVGKRFTMRVSRQGEIVDPGLDELFLAAAVDLMETEDDMMREQLKDRAAAAIEKTDQRFGSRRERTMALKKQLEASPFMNRPGIRDVLDHLVAVLPAKPIQSGDVWVGPLAVRVGMPLDMSGTYAVTALDEASCTIESQGERGEAEEPVVQQKGDLTISNKLAGSSQVKWVIDRKTGWLVRKEQKTTLAGKTLMVSATGKGPQGATPIAMEITTTVTSVE